MEDNRKIGPSTISSSNTHVIRSNTFINSNVYFLHKSLAFNKAYKLIVNSTLEVVGREVDVNKLYILETSIGGVGKTTVARHCAHIWLKSGRFETQVNIKKASRYN